MGTLRREIELFKKGLGSFSKIGFCHSVKLVKKIYWLLVHRVEGQSLELEFCNSYDWLFSFSLQKHRRCFSRSLSGGAVDISELLQRIIKHVRVKSIWPFHSFGCGVRGSFVSVKTFKLYKILGFVKPSWEEHSQFGGWFEFSEIRNVADDRQFLRGKKNLVSVNCRSYVSLRKNSWCQKRNLFFSVEVQGWNLDFLLDLMWSCSVFCLCPSKQSETTS